jgi:hypothetical protein
MPIKVYISQANQAHNAGPDGYKEKAGMDAISKALAGIFAKDSRFLVKRNVAGARVDTAAENADEANRWGADYYVALHSNAGMKGTIVFHHSASKAGKRLATAIYGAIAPLSPGVETGDRVRTWDGLIEIHRPHAPAVLVELDAHWTPQGWRAGVAWLTGKRRQIARALYEGTCHGVGLTPNENDPIVTVKVRRSKWQSFKAWLKRAKA